MIKRISLFLFSMTCVLLVHAQHDPLPTIPIQSVSFDFKSTNDLKTIGKSIADARVVLLGEQDHGDATSMEFKARLVKYLREEKGFKVLLFESDFYSLQKNNDISFAKDQVQPFWSKTKTMQPLWTYLQKKKMEVNGFAMGFNGDFARKNALIEFNELITKLPFQHSSNFSFTVKMFERLLNGTARGVSKEDRALFYSCSDTLLEQVERILPSEKLSAQFLYNVKAKAEHTWLNNYRVKHNTANLVWLLNNKYRHEKVIIWTANIHGVKNYPALIENDEQRLLIYNKAVDKDSVHSMAHALTLKHKISVYSLICISTSGKYTPQAWVSMNNQPETIVIGEINIEEQVTGTCFLDLKKVPNATFSMIPVLHKTTFTADWSQIFDGIIFITDQRPLIADDGMMK